MMIKWIWRMLWGSSCEHKFETIANGTIVNDDGAAIGKYFVLRCEKCGDIRTRKL